MYSVSERAIQLKQCTFLTFTLLYNSNWKIPCKETVYMGNSQHYKTLFLNFIATMSITNFCTKSMFTYRYLRHLQAKLQTKKMNPGPTRTRFITEAKL